MNQNDQNKDEGQTMHSHAECESNCDNVDAIFHETARRYGRFVLVLTTILMTIPGMITLSPVFIAAKMDFNCKRFDFDEATDISSCDIAYESCGAMTNCSSSSSYRKCKEFEFNDTTFISTSISKFNLVCDNWHLSTLPTAIYFIGFLFGCVIYGRLSDRFGRLKLLAVAAGNLSLCTIAASQSPELWLYCVSQILSGFGCGGTHTVLYTYALEIACTDSRHTWGFTLHHGWSAGVLIGSLLAYFIRDYQWLLLSYGVYAAPLVIVALLLPESPRWLSSVKRFKDADAALHRMVRFSGNRLSPTYSSEVAHARQEAVAAELVSAISLTSTRHSSDSVGFIDLIRTPGMRRLTLSSWWMYFASAQGFFGISLGVGELGGSIFLNQVYCGAAELPARVLAMFASGRIGRIVSMRIVFGMSGLCLLATAALFQFPQLVWLRVCFAMIGKFWVTIAFDLSLLYAAEAFPTVIRSSGIGSGSAAARAGALSSTIISHLSVVWQPLPFLIIAGFLLSVTLVSFLLPETKGRQLPDTLKQGEKFVLGHCKHRPAQNLVDGELKMVGL